MNGYGAGGAPYLFILTQAKDARWNAVLFSSGFPLDTTAFAAEFSRNVSPIGFTMPLECPITLLRENLHLTPKSSAAYFDELF